LLGFNTLDVKVQPVPFIFSFLPGIGFNTLDVKVQRGVPSERYSRPDNVSIH